MREKADLYRLVGGPVDDRGNWNEGDPNVEELMLDGLLPNRVAVYRRGEVRERPRDTYLEGKALVEYHWAGWRSKDW